MHALLALLANHDTCYNYVMLPLVLSLAFTQIVNTEARMEKKRKSKIGLCVQDTSGQIFQVLDSNTFLPPVY